MNTKYFMHISLIILLLVLIGFMIPQVSFSKIESEFTMSAQSINASEFNGKIGVATQTDELNFGRLPIGSKSTKFIDISNSFSRDSKTELFVEGNISEFVSFPNEIILAPSESEEITILFNSTQIGNYTGNFTSISYVAKNSFAEKILNYI